MIELIDNLPDNVVGLRAIGKVTGDDYERVVVPEVEARFRRHRKIRLLYHLGPEFDGFDAGAVWEDTKIGLRHLLQFERIAVVSDVDWVRSGTRAAGFLIPAEVRLFANDELGEAERWLAE